MRRRGWGGSASYGKHKGAPRASGRDVWKQYRFPVNYGDITRRGGQIKPAGARGDADTRRSLDGLRLSAPQSGSVGMEAVSFVGGAGADGDERPSSGGDGSSPRARRERSRQRRDGAIPRPFPPSS